MKYEHWSREELYSYGRILVKAFLEYNRELLGRDALSVIFRTYEEAESFYKKPHPIAYDVWHKVKSGPTQGTGTGLYVSNHIFVNLPRTALPIQNPIARSWSFPGWKTDRTAVGVLAHETGHYIEHLLQRRGILTKTHGQQWRDLIRDVKKQVSGYEPVPSEAAAETMRMFILNPDLLKQAIPERYGFFLSLGLQPSERRRWKDVLSNENYFDAGDRWIAKKR